MAQQVEWSRGWVQREPRHLLQPGELLEALNLIPNDAGALSTRLGHTLVGTTAQMDVHTLYTAYTAEGVRVRYQGAGTVLYKDFLPIVTGLQGHRLSAATMRGFGEDQNYTFFAGGEEEVRIKDDGLPRDTPAGVLRYPNGGVSQWGIAPPSFSPTVSAPFAHAPAQLSGTYGWRAIFVRKPVIRSSLGRWTDATQTRETPIPGSPAGVTVTDGTPVNGIWIGGDRPYGEVVFGFSTPASASAVYAYSYWNGHAYVRFYPIEEPAYTTFGVSRLVFHFPVSNWVPLNGQYIIIVNTFTPPATPATMSGATTFDSVVAAQSSPSIQITAGTALTVGNSVTLTLPSASVVGTADYDPQVTHLQLYRTQGNDPAFVIPGTITGDPLFFFEREFPINAPPYIPIKPDSQLQELMELDNDRPLRFVAIAEHQRRLFGLRENKLYFSKPDQPESWPALNYVEFGNLGDPGNQLAPYDGNLYVSSQSHLYILLGNDEFSYELREIQCPTGVGAPASVARGALGIYYLGGDGNLWRLQGSATAVNISHADHYPLFHDAPSNGVLPLTQSLKEHCVGTWANNRYYFAYPNWNIPQPDEMLVIDEETQSWWRDSRGPRALYYDRQGNELLGSSGTTGAVWRFDDGETDAGTPVHWVAQTRDEDENAPESEKTLTHVALEVLTGLNPLIVEAVPDYGSVLVPFGICPPVLTRQAIRLGADTAGSPRALAWGLRFSGTGRQVVYRMVSFVVLLPPRRSAFDTLPSVLGIPGVKIVTGLMLDLEVLDGPLACDVLADGVIVDAVQVTTMGRQQVTLLRTAHLATVLQLFLSMPEGGTFLLYPTSYWTVRTAPPPGYLDTIPPNDLGVPQDKSGIALTLDVALAGPGTLQTELWVDGVLAHTIFTTGNGRFRSQRYRLPGEASVGKLFELRRRCDVPFEDWGGHVTFAALGIAGLQTVRLAAQQGGQLQQIPIQG